MFYLLLTRTNQIFKICYKAHSYLDRKFFHVATYRCSIGLDHKGLLYSVSYSTHIASSMLDTCC